MRARFVAVWTQIAKHFASYGEELIFESMNEIHDGYGKPDPRTMTFINELNQAFVDLVRASGGNNASATWWCPATTPTSTIRSRASSCRPIRRRAGSSCRCTTTIPYLFALQAKTHTWGSAARPATTTGGRRTSSSPSSTS